MAIRFSLIFVICLLFLLGAACALLLFQTGSPAFADGGAPDLAYVAGTVPGVSVIDVAQQRVSRTLSINGNPRTILLSSDGRFLYTTEPTRGRVSVLDAASGGIQCSLRIPGQPSLLVLAPFDQIDVLTPFWLGYVFLVIMFLSALLLVFLLFVARRPGKDRQ